MGQISASAVKMLRDQTGAGMMECKRALTDAGGDLEKAVGLLRERGLAKAVKREGRATSEGTIAMSRSGTTGTLVELGSETDFVAKTDEFQALARALADAAVADAALDSVEALLETSLDGETARDRITAAISKIGENIVLKRVARLEVDGVGLVGGYVHAGGKLGVLVGLRTDAQGAELEEVAKDLAMHVAAADPTPLAVERDGLPEDLVARERALYRKQAEQSGKPANLVDKIAEGRLNKFYSEVCLVEQPFIKDPDRRVRDVLREGGARLEGELTITGFVRFKLGEALES